MKKNNKKGFTLAELLVVVGIIAILIAVAIPTFTAATAKAEYGVELANARSVYAEAKIEALSSDDGDLPENYSVSYDGVAYAVTEASGTYTVTLDSNAKQIATVIFAPNASPAVTEK